MQLSEELAKRKEFRRDASHASCYLPYQIYNSAVMYKVAIYHLQPGLIYYAHLLGRVPLCSKRPERAPHIGGFCLPLCWRCSGLLLGTAAALILCMLLLIELPALYKVGLVLPMAFDALASGHSCRYQSSNFKRVLSGFLCGLTFF